jgi:hypothetical protein
MRKNKAIAPYNHEFCSYRVGRSVWCVHKGNTEKYANCKKKSGRKSEVNNLSKCCEAFCPLIIKTKGLNTC